MTSRKPRRRLTTWAAAIALVVPLTGTAAAADDDCDEAPFTDRSDVAPVHRDNVDCAHEAGIAQGYTDGTFRPRDTVARDQMASLIHRTLEVAGVELPEPEESDGFDDTEGNVHEDAIRSLHAAGVVRGRDEDTYAPDGVVYRDQTAAFVIRSLALARDRDVEELLGGGAPFGDIAGSEHEDAIEGAYRRGLVKGKDAERYAPREGTSREQKATLMVRLLGPLQVRADTDLDATSVQAGGILSGVIHADDVDGVTVSGAGMEDAEARLGEGSTTFEVDLPDDLEPGEYEITIEVTYDDGETETHSFTITVTAADDAPAELTDATFEDAGDQRVFGDTDGDLLLLTFDGELDEVAEDADGQVVVSDDDGGDITLQQSEALAYEIDGTTLGLRVEDAAQVDDVDDIHYRWVTIVDEVYDTAGNEVTVPEDGVRIGDFDPDAEPAELTGVEFTPEGDEDAYGDAEGDTLTLTFDGELDEYRLGRDGDPQVTLSTQAAEGDDTTLTDGEGVEFTVEGSDLDVTVDDTQAFEAIDDIRNRRVTIVDEVYDANGNEVTVPDDGVWVDEAPAELQSAVFSDAGGEQTFGDAEGDELTLTFDTELDRVAEDADGQVTVSDDGGDDVNLQESEALTFAVEGDVLTLEVVEPGNVTDVDDILERAVTVVDEVYDVNGFEVVADEVAVEAA